MVDLGEESKTRKMKEEFWKKENDEPTMLGSFWIGCNAKATLVLAGI